MDAALSVRRDELVARIRAGEVFPARLHGVCPVCGASFDRGRYIRNATATCNSAQCVSVWRSVRTKTAGMMSQPPRYTERRIVSYAVVVTGDPWWCRTLDGYERTADPGLGF